VGEGGGRPRALRRYATRTLDFEESDTLDGLLNGNSWHISMCGKLKEAVCGQNGQHGTACMYSKRVAVHHPISWAFRRPSSESAFSLSPSRLPSWPTRRHGGRRPHTSPIRLACQENHAQSRALPPRVPIGPLADVVERAHGSDSSPDGPTDGALLGSGGDERPAP